MAPEIAQLFERSRAKAEGQVKVEVISAYPLSAAETAKLNAAMVKVLGAADVRIALSNVGAEVVGGSPEQFTAFIASERVKYAKIIKDANIRIE